MAQRVLIVGSGAAGTAAAWSLARHDRFEVELWEAESQAGGVATSERVNEARFGAGWINDGVQGGAPTYRNTAWLHRQVGYEPRHVDFRVSFGRGDTAWNNTAPTELVHRLQPEIARFDRWLDALYAVEPLAAVLPIHLVLRLGRFSAEFRDHMLFPLVALFFGTGNQTRRVSSALVARLFKDPQLRLFDYDPRSLLAERPPMFAFDRLDAIYRALIDAARAEGRVRIHFERPLRRLVRDEAGVTAVDATGAEARFDQVIFACPARTALRCLDAPSFRERNVLGAVQYFHDVTVTHTDRAYMERYYELDDARGDHYFIRTYPDASDRIEMSFDLSHYQGQLDRSVYQTIFLDRDHDGHRWTKGEIDPNQVLFEKPWIQFSHTWQHYARVVPFLRFLQGHRRCYYAGSWTLANTHEIATISGLAAAHRLGAPYPVEADPLAADQFATYLRVAHGQRGTAPGT